MVEKISALLTNLSDNKEVTDQEKEEAHTEFVQMCICIDQFIELTTLICDLLDVDDKAQIILAIVDLKREVMLLKRDQEREDG